LANLPAQRLAAWFATPAGQRVLHGEAAPLAQALRRAHGDRLLWLGCPQVMADAVQGCMVRSRLLGSVVPGAPVAEIARLQCAQDALPFLNNSLDALVLHHALETAADPRGALREAARVLAPGGRLIVCAFNPLSLWGLRRCFAQFAPDPFKGLHLLTTARLADWLKLLGFEVQGRPRHLQFGLPFHRQQALQEPNPLQRLLERQQIPVGGVYLLAATKRALAVRPDWRPAPRMPTPAFGKVAFGNRNVIRLPVSRPRLAGRDLPAGE
jgi:SAM-dependent methyltransferase